MDELSRMLLHGTSGLRSAEEAMDGDLGAALRDRAVSEWAAEPQPQRRTVYRPSPPIVPRWLAHVAWVLAAVLILLILIH